jgi:Tfp pilus assembly protein PilN
VKAVNLLPERHRPRRASGGRQGSSYAVLGVLGALLLALVVYVLTLNSINSGQDQIAVAKAETEQAQSQSRSLSAYGDFAKVKQKRVAAVTQLAKGRFDWERLVRELAHVLPENVWLVKTDARRTGGKAERLRTRPVAGGRHARAPARAPGRKRREPRPLGEA